jgi:hypothetical protein
MSARDRRGAGAYARAIEGALARSRERPVILSPRDWALVSEWYAREVPLALVLELLEEEAARERRGKRRRAPGLAHLSTAVQESWDAVRGGRADRLQRPRRLPALGSVRQAWQRAAAEAAAGSPLERSITRLLERLDRGDPAVELDRDLDRVVLSCSPRALLTRLDPEVRAEIEPFRSRMAPERFTATRNRALAARLRQALNLPRLSRADDSRRRSPR